MKADDGAAGAGMVIERMRERAGLRDHLVVVTRWYGASLWAATGFRHVQEKLRFYLAGL